MPWINLIGYGTDTEQTQILTFYHSSSPAHSFPLTPSLSAYTHTQHFFCTESKL